MHFFDKKNWSLSRFAKKVKISTRALCHVPSSCVSAISKYLIALAQTGPPV